MQPSSFETIHQIFTKFKSLALKCKQCGIERKDEQLALSVLNKIGSDYSLFVSTFHFGRDSIPNWKIPSLGGFAEFLIQEQEKLVQMGVLQTSKNQYFLMINSTNAQAKGRHKGKESKAFDLNPKESQKSFEGASRSKRNKKCPYCMRGFHPKSHCMKKQIDQLSTLLEQNNIALPHGVRNYYARPHT